MAAASSSRSLPQGGPSSSGVEARSAGSSSVVSAAEASPAASSASVGDHFVQLSLGACLAPWLDCFSSLAAQWGMVTDVREDGTTYQRHGVIVDVVAYASAFSRDNSRHLWRIRRAIDLLRLALAIDPSVLKSVVATLQVGPENEDIGCFARRDVPFEVRFELEVDTNVTLYLEQMLVRRLMKDFDAKQVDESDELRRHLVDQVLCRSSYRRLSQLPVMTKLLFALQSAKIDRLESDLDCLAKTSNALHAYQEQRHKDWTLAKVVAPLVVDKISLFVDSIPLRSSVLNKASTLMNSGIKVYVGALNFDCQGIACKEAELQSFLGAIATTGNMSIWTGRTRRRGGAAGTDSLDVSAKVIMVLRCIGQVPDRIYLDLEGLLSVCQTREDRHAVICGLVNFILPRETPVELDFLDGIAFDGLDAHELLHVVGVWRNVHPDQKLRLKSIDVNAQRGSIDFIRAMIQSLDDVEDISLELSFEDVIVDEDLQSMLRYPSLRSLSIRNIRISSMDIFASTNRELRLETLELSALTLRDSSSVGRFVKSLDPGTSPGGLSRTLQRLSIIESDVFAVHFDDEDNEDNDDNGVRLAINDAAAVDALAEVLDSNSVLVYVHFVGDFRSHPVIPAWEHPATTSYIRTPGRCRPDELALAQKAAFLSGVQEGTSAAARAFDSNIVHHIYAFNYSVPTVQRKIFV